MITTPHHTDHQNVAKGNDTKNKQCFLKMNGMRNLITSTGNQ